MRRYMDWIRQADGELKAANDLNKTKNYAWCCFACHQAAEKAIKAMLDFSRKPAFGHSLPTLINDLTPSINIPTKVIEAAYRLNRFYIPTRYPDAFPSGAPVDMFTKQDAEDALKDSRLVIQYAKSLTKIS